MLHLDLYQRFATNGVCPIVYDSLADTFVNKEGWKMLESAKEMWPTPGSNRRLTTSDIIFTGRTVYYNLRRGYNSLHFQHVRFSNGEPPVHHDDLTIDPARLWAGQECDDRADLIWQANTLLRVLTRKEVDELFCLSSAK